MEVALGWTLRAHALLMDLHATDVVEGPRTKAVFETNLERVLTPSLRHGQVVMDNLSSHKGPRVRELVET